MSTRFLATHQCDQVNLILNTILERCINEKNCNYLQVPLEDCYERVSYYTAYPKTYVYQISQKENSKKNKNVNLTLDPVIILQCVKSLLEASKLPTVSNLFEYFQNQNLPSTVKNITNNQDLSSFQAEITNLGYEYKKTLKGPLVIIENPKITFDRYNYLKKIKILRARGDKTFYYIDQRVVDYEFDFKKPLLPCPNKILENGLFYSVMISSSSYEHGLFTNQASEETLLTWVRDILLPMMTPSSIVILDNNPFCGAPMNTVTRYHTKNQMREWLREYDIPFDSCMAKAELFDIIDRCTIRNKVCFIETIFKAYGHEVLYLPPVNNLSPTHLLWTHVMSNVNKSKNDLNLIRKNVLQFMATITESQWAEFEVKVRELERILYDLDSNIEKYFDDVCQLDTRYDLESS